MAPVVAVIRFPGTNCEFDAAEVLAGVGKHATRSLIAMQYGRNE